MGMAVPDNHTYVWRLGELCPKYDFDNGGVGSFGPWQCYLHLKDIFTPGKYDIVIYSSIADHCIRNPYTVYCIFDGSIVFLPYVSNENGQWIEHEAKIVSWPGDNISRTVNLI